MINKNAIKLLRRPGSKTGALFEKLFVCAFLCAFWPNSGAFHSKQISHHTEYFPFYLSIIETMYDEDFKRANFATKYNSFNLIFNTVTIVVVSILSYTDSSASNSNLVIAKVGENLCSPSNLFIQALIQFLIILLSKYLSAYRGALEFPKAEDFPPNWNSSKKASVSKKIGLKLRSFSRHLTPIKAFFTYLFFLLLSWVFVAYIVVCFGKDFFLQFITFVSLIVML